MKSVKVTCECTPPSIDELLEHLSTKTGFRYPRKDGMIQVEENVYLK